MLSMKIPDVMKIEQEVRAKMAEKRFIGVELPEKLWDTLKVSTQLVITGESINLEKRLETLTNLYNSLLQVNPPAAEKVLSKIMALTGENYDTLAGVKPMTQQNQALQGTGIPQGGSPIATGKKEDALMGQITNAPQV